MKTTLLFIFMVFLSPSLIFAQRNIDYDFGKKEGHFGDWKSSKNNHTKFMEETRIRILNVNPFLYDVVINGEEVSVVFSAENPMMSIAFPNAGVSNLSADENTLHDSDKEKSSLYNENLLQLKTLYYEFIKNYNNLLNKKDLYNDLLFEIQNPEFDTGALKESAFKILMKDKYFYLAQLNSHSLKEKLDNSLEEFYKSYNDFSKLIFEMSFAKTESNDALDKNRRQLNKKIEDNSEIIKSLKTKVDSAKAQVDNANLQNHFNKTVSLYRQIERTDFIFMSGPVIPTRDELAFHVEITPKDSLPYFQGTRTEIFDIPLYVRGKFNINLSAGIGITNLQDKKYEYIPDLNTDTSERKKIVEQSIGSSNVGGLILANFYWRLSLMHNAAISSGVMFDQDNRIKFPLGISYIYGNRARVVFTGGVIFGNVARIQDDYQLNIYYENLPESVPVKEYFSNNFFASVTFNLKWEEIRTGFGSKSEKKKADE